MDPVTAVQPDVPVPRTALRPVVPALGALAMMGTLFCPWLRTASLHGVVGYRLANLVLALHLSIGGVAPGLLAAGLYIVPVAGAVAWLALLVLAGSTRQAVVTGAGAVGSAVAAIWIAIVVHADAGSMGTGLWLAAIGSIAVTVS